MPPRRALAGLLAASLQLSACAALLSGCARFPAGSNNTVGRQLDVRMTLAGPIDPNAYYFVVFNVSNDANGTAGPVPVVAPPWGNGFVAPAPSAPSGSTSATSFVEYTGSQNGFVLYNFTPSSQPLQTYVAAGTLTAVSASGSTLEFRVPLSQLATSSIPAASIASVQVNFIATNLVPAGLVDPISSGSAPKLFDALGNGQLHDFNEYVTISAAQDGTFGNSLIGSASNAYEPQNDVVQTYGNDAYPTVSDSTAIPGDATGATAASLDIVDWQIRVQG